MVNAEECRWETEQYQTQERQRIERKKEECRQYPWWDPRGWMCSIVTFFETVWVTVVTTIRSWVCSVAEAIEEAERYVAVFVRWLLGIIDHLAGVFITGNSTGNWPIVASTTRPVPSRPCSIAFTRSFSMATDFDAVDSRAPYQPEGVHIDFSLNDGVVEWWIHSGPHAHDESTPFSPQVDYFPPLEDVVPTTKPTAVSFDDRRLGDWGNPPKFDLIAAGGDRLIAKAEGTDAIYIAILNAPFIHFTITGSRIPLPQSFSKLDPECGVMTAKKKDLLAHLRVQGDDERHVATERFPLFRALYNNYSWDFMTTWFAPRIWYKLDTRPRKDTADPPARYPTYDHVVYLSNLPSFPSFSRERMKRSVRFERVMDLGVGVSHFHEQHDNRFGGEADSLSGKGGTTGKLLAGIREWAFGGKTFDAAYRFANGPISDYGGWLDGTCTYFMLVQLKRDKEISEESWADTFAILWADEHSVFTERWRVLHIYERDFTSPFQPIVGEISRLEEEYYPDAIFDGDRYFCPFQAGFIRTWSRMVVARQHIAVTGLHSDGSAQIYTIHFTWGTMDKTWRRRQPPTQSANATVQLDSIALRNDATLLIPGSVIVSDKTIAGYWSQHVLPASEQETPSVVALAGEPPFRPRVAAYPHPWRFVASDPSEFMHKSFSHYGVLEAVDSRVQCYRIGQIEFHNTIMPGEMESICWVDTAKVLQITHDRLSYSAAAAALEGGVSTLTRIPEAISQAVERNEPYRSSYSQALRFRVVKRPGLGWILMHADLREDKLIGFDDTDDKLIELIEDGSQQREIAIRRLCHIRNERDPHGATVGREEDGVSPPAISTCELTVSKKGKHVDSLHVRFEVARAHTDAIHPKFDNFAEWVAMNVWRVKLAFFSGADTVDLLFDVVRESAFAPTEDEQTYEYEWYPSASDQRDGLLCNVLSHGGAILYGTSIWFVGSTGLVATADEVKWLDGK